MKTGIVLITHPGVGDALLKTASMILQGADLAVQALDIAMDEDCELSQHNVQTLIAQADRGNGVLILNDIYGATPFNITKAVLGDKHIMLSGLNLNMLLRAITYQELPPKELADKAREGGLNGVRLI